MPLDSELNEQNNVSRANQQITRRDRSELRFVKNLEKQALNTTGSSARRREIRGAADDMRAIITARTTDERGKLEEGIIYDSKQYSKPTFNSGGTEDKSTGNRGIDSINSEEAPGNSQGGAAGGVPNDNSTPSPEDPGEDPGDGSLRPNDWYSYANGGNNDLIFGTPGATGSVNSLQINYTGLALKCTNPDGGFNVQDSSGNAKINVFMQDLPGTVSTSDPAKFREVKVCFNGVPATMSVLGSKPVAS